MDEATRNMYQQAITASETFHMLSVLMRGAARAIKDDDEEAMAIHGEAMRLLGEGLEQPLREMFGMIKED